MSNHPQSTKIDRREALRRVTAMLGGYALVGGSGLLTACAPRRIIDTVPDDTAFSAAEIQLLDEIAETILPETDTPGAKAAGVGPFMAVMVNDVYTREEQDIFHAGMEDLQARSQAEFGQGFVAANPDQRLALLEQLDREQHDHQSDKDHDEPTHYFRMMKELALFGYFTSEIGYTQAMRYVERPGRYDPCVPYQPGERSWADHL